MNRTTIRQLIDASLGISHQQATLDTVDQNNTKATGKRPASPKTLVAAAESESDPSPPTVASSDGTGVE